MNLEVKHIFNSDSGWYDRYYILRQWQRQFSIYGSCTTGGTGASSSGPWGEFPLIWGCYFTVLSSNLLCVCACGVRKVNMHTTKTLKFVLIINNYYSPSFNMTVKITLRSWLWITILWKVSLLNLTIKMHCCTVSKNSYIQGNWTA